MTNPIAFNNIENLNQLEEQLQFLERDVTVTWGSYTVKHYTNKLPPVEGVPVEDSAR